jgi:hypothetical protein
MRLKRKRKCKHCHQLFHPDSRNVKKQEYCSQPECRKKSKAASQRKWRAKSENRDYFKGPENVKRVQGWRKLNPGYWRKRQKPKEPLQDHSSSKTKKRQDVTTQLTLNALQDLLSAQDIVFLGLLANLSGSALQDDIVTCGRRLQQLGQDILNQPFDCKGGSHDNRQKAYLPPSDPPGA